LAEPDREGVREGGGGAGEASEREGEEEDDRTDRLGGVESVTDEIATIPFMPTIDVWAEDDTTAACDLDERAFERGLLGREVRWWELLATCA
jgi:hypothetical protein